MRQALGALPLLMVVLACNKDEPITVITPVSSPSASVVPVDHLAPSELLEGNANAFGLVLPRGVHVDNAFSDVVFASGQVPLSAAVKYLRARVREGKMVEPEVASVQRTTFDHVRIPAMPDKEFIIFVQPAVGLVATTKIEVHDVTPTKAPDLPNEAARWAASGLKPNGQPLDPAHLQ